jgi:hypothetical protein
MSMHNFYEGHGANVLVYGIEYNSYYPPIVSTLVDTTDEISYTIPTNILTTLIPYNIVFTDVELRTNDVVTTSSLCNKITNLNYDSNNVFEMSIGTYLFESSDDIAFMNNGKSEFITCNGVSRSKILAPDNIYYNLYHTTTQSVRDKNNTGQYLDTYTNYVYTCIIVQVTGDFGYLSVYNADGTLWQNFCKYKK